MRDFGLAELVAEMLVADGLAADGVDRAADVMRGGGQSSAGADDGGDLATFEVVEYAGTAWPMGSSFRLLGFG